MQLSCLRIIKKVSIKKPCALLLTLLCCTSFASASTLTQVGGEDTILIEKTMSYSTSYSQALKSLTKRIFNFDVDSLLSGGQNIHCAVIRNFSEFAARTKYRVEVKPEQINLKFSLNF